MITGSQSHRAPPTRIAAMGQFMQTSMIRPKATKSERVYGRMRCEPIDESRALIDFLVQMVDATDMATKPAAQRPAVTISQNEPQAKIKSTPRGSSAPKPTIVQCRSGQMR